MEIGSAPRVGVYTGVDHGAGVCVFIGLYVGGVFNEAGYTIGIAGVSAVPAVDADVAACPTSDDVVAGAVGDPTNPLVHTPYRVAAGVYGDTAQVCIVTRDVRARLLFVAQAGEPELVIRQGAPSGASPVVSPGSASSACRDNGNSPLTAAVGGGVGVHVGWAYRDTNTVYFCVRSGGVGGRLRVDADGSAGPILWWTPTASCTTSWWTTTAPVATSVRTGPVNPAGATPVCITIAGFEINYLVYGDYRPGTPTADWVFDS